MKNIEIPKIISGIFDEYDFINLQTKLMSMDKKTLPFVYQEAFGRYAVVDANFPLLKYYTEKILPLAREIFESNTLLPSYTLFCHYEGNNAKLWKHKDDNACTYTLDMHVYFNDMWDLWVEDKKYSIYPNEALSYYGNDQEHWREEFPNPESNYLGAIFFHFVEPDHDWFKK